MQKLRVALLGEPAVMVDNGPSLHFRTDKILALLVYLLVEGDRPHQRQFLAALLWPDMPQVLALKNLRQSLHRLQQTLNEQLPTLDKTLFTVTRQSIQSHRSDLLEVDVLAFRHLLAAYEAHRHRHLHLCHECLERLTRAATLYQGELLAGFGLPDATAFEEWLLLRRERLQQQAIAALGRLTTAHSERGDNDLAYTYAARQVALDPFREEAHRQLMRLLALSGQHTRALVQYERCRHLLYDELGVEPAAETTALYREIQAAQRGEAVPAVTRKPAALHNLPLQYTPFVGRRAEMEQIGEFFLDPDSRMLTLVGPGGMGKTRVSIRASEQLAGKSAFPDGIYFFSLATVHSTDLLLTTLITGLGMPLSGRATPRERLLDYLRNRQCLLVLDNFEQLVESAPVLAEMLDAAPGLRLLVTSHTPLHLRAERQLALTGLDYPAEDDSSSDPLAYSAVRLFVELAHQVDGTFSLTTENEEAILEICRLVYGIPLALELAASWVRFMDCATIAQEIARSLDFLSTSSQDMTARHQSMAAIFVYSWNFLTAEEQAVLGQLSVFRGPFSLEAAMAVTDATPLVIASLMDRSLLQRTRDGRYQLHELLRQFASRQAAEQVPQAAQRHSEYYLNLVARQESALHGPQPRQAAGELQPHLSNIREAWQRAIDHDDWQAIEGSLDGMGRFFQVMTLIHEGVVLFGQALSCSEQSPAGISQTGRLLLWHAYFLEKQGQHGEAIQQAWRALERAGQDEAARADAQSMLGKLLPHEGKFEQAKEYERQAIDYYRAASDLGRLAASLRRMAITCWRGIDYDEALYYFQKAIPIYQALEHKQGLAQVYSAMAGVYWERGEQGEVLIYTQRARDLFAAIGDDVGTVTVDANLALVYRRMGQYDQALAANQRAIDSSQAVGDRFGLAIDLHNRGDILLEKGEFEASLSCYYHAVDIEKALGNVWGIALHRAGIAAVHHMKGDEELALTYYDLALPVLLAHGAPYYAIQPLLEKAELLYRRGEWLASRSLSEQALALATEVAAPNYIWQSHLLAAKLDFAQGNAADAQARLEALLAESDEETERATVYYELWRMTQERAHWEAALILYEQAHERAPSATNKVRLEELQHVLSS